MLKFFISQPMRQRSDQEILQERLQIHEILTQHFYTNIIIIDSFIENAPNIKNPLKYLGRSLEYLAEADAAVFAPNWHKARGCQIELLACLSYDIPVFEVKYQGGRLCLI